MKERVGVIGGEQRRMDYLGIGPKSMRVKQSPGVYWVFGGRAAVSRDKLKSLMGVGRTDRYYSRFHRRSALFPYSY